MNVHSVSIIGRRSENEDKHITELNGDGKNTDLINVNLFGVFDGHGGDEVSELLSQEFDNILKKEINIAQSV